MVSNSDKALLSISQLEHIVLVDNLDATKHVDLVDVAVGQATLLPLILDHAYFVAAAWTTVRLSEILPPVSCVVADASHDVFRHVWYLIQPNVLASGVTVVAESAVNVHEFSKHQLVNHFSIYVVRHAIMFLHDFIFVQFVDIGGGVIIAARWCL